VAQLTANWQVTPETMLTGFFDYRNVPFLTTRNAIQGRVGGSRGWRASFRLRRSSRWPRTGRRTRRPSAWASRSACGRLQLAFGVCRAISPAATRPAASRPSRAPGTSSRTSRS
jgi:hypothetical protein